MVDLARARVESWSDGSTVDVLREMQDLTLRIVCSALFRLDDDAAEDRATLVSAVHAFAASLNVVLRRAFPIPGWIPPRATGCAADRRRGRRARLRPDRAGVGPGAGRRPALLARPGHRRGWRTGTLRCGDSRRADDDVLRRSRDQRRRADLGAAICWPPIPTSPTRCATRSRAWSGTAPSRWPTCRSCRCSARWYAETLRLYPPAWVFDRSPLHDIVVGGFAIPARRERPAQPLGGAPGSATLGGAGRVPAGAVRRRLGPTARGVPSRSVTDHGCVSATGSPRWRSCSCSPRCCRESICPCGRCGRSGRRAMPRCGPRVACGRGSPGRPYPRGRDHPARPGRDPPARRRARVAADQDARAELRARPQHGTTDRARRRAQPGRRRGGGRPRPRLADAGPAAGRSHMCTRSRSTRPWPHACR